MKMTRHGLTAPPLVPGGGGSPPHHGRPPPVAIAVDRRSAGGLCLWIEGPDLDFRFSRQGATNNTTTSLDDVNVELVPGLCDIVGHRASGGDVWACDVAAGDPQNTQQSIGGRRNNPPLLDEPRCWRRRSRGTGDGPRASRRSRHAGRGRGSAGKRKNGRLARGVPCQPAVVGFLSLYLRFGAPNNQPAGERDEEDKTIYARHGSGDRGAQRLE